MSLSHIHFHSIQWKVRKVGAVPVGGPLVYYAHTPVSVLVEDPGEACAVGVKGHLAFD